MNKINRKHATKIMIIWLIAVSIGSFILQFTHTPSNPDTISLVFLAKVFVFNFGLLAIYLIVIFKFVDYKPKDEVKK